MTRFLWQLPTWPDLRWDSAALQEPLSAAYEAQGRLLGRLSGLGIEDERGALEVEALVDEAVTTSAIEGERLSKDSVRSSLARRLGLDTAGLPPPSREVDGLVEMLLDATERHDQPLTVERLQGWQAALFPSGRSGLARIRVGAWRPGPVEVVSGPAGRERVHFEGPPAERVADEVDRLLAWWGSEAAELVGMVRAGVAHLWLETIHPFEDGNGRVGRALAEMALAQGEGRRRRVYSLSSQVHVERQPYYRILEETQRGDGDVTGWLVWFLGCLRRAIERSEGEVEKVVRKARFWQRIAPHALNARQRKALTRLLESGPEGFEGGLSNRKYRGMTSASKVTATRDLADLVARGILSQIGEGRGTRYELAASFFRSHK